MINVYLLLERIDLGDRVRGVFQTEKEAELAITVLLHLRMERYDWTFDQACQNYRDGLKIECFEVGKIDFP